MYVYQAATNRMKRTTIFGDELVFSGLRELAKDKKVSFSRIIRMALEHFLTISDKKRKKKLSFVGIGNSGRVDISSNAEDLLWKK
jgi:hypothetical protein